MNRFKRCLSGLMCLALIMTGLPVFAEGGQENSGIEVTDTPAALTVDVTPEPTEEPTAEPTTEPAAEVTPKPRDITETVAPGTTSEPTPAPSATAEPEAWFYFKNDSVELDLHAHKGVNVYETLDMVICGNEDKAAFFWITSDADVVSVHQDELTVYGEGTATLTAVLMTNRSITDEITVVVTESIEITGPELVRESTGAELGLQYLNGEQIDPASAEWSTSDKEIATVVNGNVSFRKAGEVTITARYGDLEASRTFNVLSIYGPDTSPDPGEPTAAPTDEPGPAVQFASEKITIDRFLLNGENAVKKLKLILNGVDAEDITWTTSDYDVVHVIETLAFSNKTGTATLRAALKSDPTVYDEITVTITLDYQLSAPDTGLVGQTYTFSCTYLNGVNVGNTNVKWTSSDETTATVVDGEVYCIKPGAVTITAEYNGISYKKLFVIPAPEDPFTVNDVNMFSNGSGRLVLTTSSGSEIDYSKVTYVFPDATAADHFTIDDNGTITPIVDKEGKLATYNEVTYDVQVIYGGCTDTARVTIRQAKVSYFLPNGVEGGAEYLTLYEECSVEPDLHIQFLPNSTNDYPVSYVSTDETVFSCDSEANTITGVKKGTAELIVTMRSGSVFRIPVEVKIPITSITLEEPGRTFVVGDTFVLNASYKPMNADHPIHWSSSNSNIVAVDNNGRITCKAEGYASILAYSEKEGVNAKVEIYVVKPVEKILFYKGIMDHKTEYTIGQGKTFLPVIEIYPKDATLAGYAMTTSDASVVQFTDAGKIIGVGSGTAVVTFTSLDGCVSRDITVNVVPKKYAVTSFKLSASKVSLGEGASKTIKPKFNSSAYDRTVTWVSDSPSVATVDANGKITAVAPGTATIYAMCSTGAYKSVKVTVKVQKPTKVKLNVTKGSIYPGQEYQFKATVYPTTIVREEMLALKWKSSNTDVAIVTDEGYLYAIAPGKATITVTTVNGKKATCKVTVKKRTATSVNIVNPYTEFIVGGSYDLDAQVLPENVTNSAVTWSSSNKKIATVNSSTGVVTCKKAGTVKITAKAKDGSGKKKVITIKVVNMPLNSMNVTIDGSEVVKQSTVTLPYGQSITVKAVSDPVMYVEYKTSDARVATFENGVITATGCGKATLTVTFGGQHARTFYVEVPYSENAPRYRALVISQYATQGKSGFLPFSTNSSTGIVNALQLSDLEGSRYDVTYKKDLTSTAQVTSAIRTAFADAKEGDVSVVYIMTHATISNGVFRWHLTKKNGKTVYMYPADVMNVLKEIKGDVVLMVLSCKSGGDVENAENLTGMVRDLDNASDDSSSYSVICASEGTMRASYADTDPSFSYDFFTYGLCQSLGWDMRQSIEAATSADANGDGVITLKEFAQATEAFTREECAAFIAKYGTSAYFGPAEQRQDVSYYLSPDADNVTVFAK